MNDRQRAAYMAGKVDGEWGEHRLYYGFEDDPDPTVVAAYWRGYRLVQRSIGYLPSWPRRDPRVKVIPDDPGMFRR